MKLFGNSKKSRTSRERRTPLRERMTDDPIEQPNFWQEPDEVFTQPAYDRPYAERESQNRPSQFVSERREVPKAEPAREVEETDPKAGSKALLLLISAAALFLCSIIMCFALINKSAEVEPLPTAPTGTVKDIKYVVNSAPPETVEMPVELTEPASVYDSERLNILLIGLQGDRTDTMMIASINLYTRELSLLSLPRDTYVAGSYKEEKLGSVYASTHNGDVTRGIRAVKEQISGMLGFRPDYYFVLNEASVSAALKEVGELTFEIPQSPNHTSLSSGEKTLDTDTALAILSYRSDFEEVEPTPTDAQRELVLMLLEALVSDETRIIERAERLAAASMTDLSAQDLAYLGYLLSGIDFNKVFSEALPGDEIEDDITRYFEVDPEDAVEILNARFNPLADDLTIYTVNFRQQTGSSTDGTFDSYGFGSSSSSGSENGNDTEPDETENETDSESEGETEAPTEEEPQPTETNAPPEESDAG